MINKKRKVIEEITVAPTGQYQIKYLIANRFSAIVEAGIQVNNQSTRFSCRLDAGYRI
jgi:hypothetical protein